MLGPGIRRAVRSVIDQSLATVHRPSRLFIGPLVRMALALPHFPAAASMLVPILQNRWLERAGGRKFCLGMGYKLFQRDRPLEAWPWLNGVLRMQDPTIDEYLLGAMCLYHGLGRFREAISLLEEANERSRKEAINRGVANDRYRVLDSLWARHIGHTATIDYVIKLGVLEGRQADDTILYLPPGSPVANRFLLDQVATRIRVIEDPAQLPIGPSAVRALHFDYLAPRLPNGTTTYFWEAAAKVHERWRLEGRGPLLTLPPDVEARGRAALRSVGVPHEAWFVALHVREGKWDGRNAGLHGMLNADIATYLPAISAITRRGGWVIRMGDPTMQPLPALANVVDYCHSDLRADWMDVFIAARCRFMIGTSSGPVYIPILYGVPTVLTNWWPPAQRPWRESDIFVPKRLRRLAGGRYLSLSETLQEPFSWCHSRHYLADHEGVEVEDNSPQAIEAAVEEMLDRLDGTFDSGAEAAELQTRADGIYKAHSAFGMGQIAADFVRRHRDLVA